MVKRPVVVGLVICREVIVDENTHHMTLVNCVRELHQQEFPTIPLDFTVCCILADGLGELNVTLEVSLLSSAGSIFAQTWRIELTDVVNEQWLFITLEKLVFPSAGRYEFVLWINGEWIAHNTMMLLVEENPS